MFFFLNKNDQFKIWLKRRLKNLIRNVKSLAATTTRETETLFSPSQRALSISHRPVVFVSSKSAAKKRKARFVYHLHRRQLNRACAAAAGCALCAAQIEPSASEKKPKFFSTKETTAVNSSTSTGRVCLVLFSNARARVSWEYYNRILLVISFFRDTQQTTHFQILFENIIWFFFFHKIYSERRATMCVWIEIKRASYWDQKKYI